MYGSEPVISLYHARQFKLLVSLWPDRAIRNFTCFQRGWISPFSLSISWAKCSISSRLVYASNHLSFIISSKLFAFLICTWRICTVLNISKLKKITATKPQSHRTVINILRNLRSLHIVWNLVRRRATRRLTRLLTMFNVLKYRNIWWNNSEISIYQYRSVTAPEPEINSI